MTERDPRKMALQIAGLRANETHLPAGERVFEDPYAERFFPEEIRAMFDSEEQVRAELVRREALMPGVNGAIVARVRYIDECLGECIAAGTRQVVIIGAGYDTRAYRIAGAGDGVRIFEVDHPLTQAEKTARIAEIFGSLPEHVTYVPVVFGEDRLDRKLLESGYDPAARTLFITEGLLMYIPPPAVDGLLTFVTRAAGPGSSIVADYFETDVVEGTSPLKEAQVLRQFVEQEGAALQFGVPAGDVETFFKQRGFDRVERVTPEACREKYFPGASRRRTVSPMFNFVHATVG